MDWNVMVQYLPQYEKAASAHLCVWVWPVSSGPSLSALSSCSSTKKCRCCAVSWAAISSSARHAAFRSGLETIEPIIQTESALSLGLSRLQTMRYVMLPQAVSIQSPGLARESDFPAQGDQRVSTISLMDLMFTAKI